MSETETPAVPFAAGDVVTLKSGGPMMTVASVLGDLAACVWFSDEEDVFRFDDLPVAVLIAVEFEEDEESGTDTPTEVDEDDD